MASVNGASRCIGSAMTVAARGVRVAVHCHENHGAAAQVPLDFTVHMVGSLRDESPSAVAALDTLLSRA